MLILWHDETNDNRLAASERREAFHLEDKCVAVVLVGKCSVKLAKAQQRNVVARIVAGHRIVCVEL